MMRVKITGLSIAAIACMSACSLTPKAQKQPEQPAAKTKVVYVLRDFPAGSPIESNGIQEALTASDKVPASHLDAQSDAVSKLASKGLKAGQVICREDVVSPAQPKPDEDWLVNYSTYDLFSHVDQEVAIKGTLTDWIIGGDHKGSDCAILSIDQLTYVRIGLPCEFSRSQFTLAQRRAAAAQRVNLLKTIGVNSVVIARGKLHRCETSSIKATRNYLLIDQGTLKITKSSW